jgi:hypothetical protein
VTHLITAHPSAPPTALWHERRQDIHQGLCECGDVLDPGPGPRSRSSWRGRHAWPPRCSTLGASGTSTSTEQRSLASTSRTKWDTIASLRATRRPRFVPFCPTLSARFGRYPRSGAPSGVCPAASQAECRGFEPLRPLQYNSRGQRGLRRWRFEATERSGTRVALMCHVACPVLSHFGQVRSRRLTL